MFVKGGQLYRAFPSVSVPGYVCSLWPVENMSRLKSVCRENVAAPSFSTPIKKFKHLFKIKSISIRTKLIDYESSTVSANYGCY